MDRYMSIFQGILSNDGEFLDVYLDGLDAIKKHCVQLSFQNNDEYGLLQIISSLLTTTSTRVIGLRLLNKFLENCSVEVLEKKGNYWTTLVLKACNDQQLQSDAYVIFDVLNKIINKSQYASSFEKSFISMHLSKIYECAVNVPSYNSKYALNCIESCLRLYPGSSGASRGIIERFLWRNMDHIDHEIVKNCGKCMHLLQQIKRGGMQGSNCKTQWKLFQLQLLSGIHSVYNEMFANCLEMYDEKIEQQILPWEKEQIEFDLEPAKKAAQMYIRCRNLITFLTTALREPFPVEKAILIKKILNVVVRGLNINFLTLEQNPIADNIAISVLLPLLHEDLLNLLITLLTVSRGHIRPYSELILGLMVDALKWTSIKNVRGGENNFWSLRKKVYGTISLWCKIFSSGNFLETFTEHIFEEILHDITPIQNEFTLKVLSGARKHMSKKTRRQLNNVQNEKSNISKTNSGANNQNEHFSEKRNLKLCIAALCCLQEIILSVGNFLKPTILKIIQISIIQISATFYDPSQKSSDLYGNENCRIEIYNALYAILMATHHLCPPPTELILAIIQIAYTRDESAKVRTRCGFILKNLEKIIHPQKESLLYTIEERDIRNTFIKMGQENLLHKFELNVTNLFSNDNVFDNDNDLGANSHKACHTTLSSNESKAMRSNNEMKNNLASTLENNNKIQKGKFGAQEEVVTKFVKDQVNDVIERETSKLSDDEVFPSISQEKNKNVGNLPQSPDILNTVSVNQGEEGEDRLNNFIIDEPVTKKQKLSNETKQHDIIINLEHNEDKILAEIASQFVDELE